MRETAKTNKRKYDSKFQDKKSGRKNNIDARNQKNTYVKSRIEIYAIIIIFLSILFFISIFTPSNTGIVFKYINYFLSYIFGIGKYIFSLLVLLWGISFFIKKTLYKKARFALGFFLFFTSVLGLISNTSSMESIFDEIFIKSRGGILGSGIFYGLFKLTNKAGANTILAFLVIISLLIITNISFADIAKKINESRARKIQETDAKYTKLTSLESEKDSAVFKDAPLIINEGKKIDLNKDYDLERKENLKEKSVKFPYFFDHVKKDSVNDLKTKPQGAAEIKKEMPVENFDSGYKPSAPIKKQSQLEMDMPENDSEDQDYRLPPDSLLKKSKALSPSLYKQDIKENITILNNLFIDFNLAAKVSGVVRGPSVTMYELALSPGVKVQRLLSLEDDFCVALGSSDIRILTPIPGKSAIGIEVPNKIKSIVTVGDVYSSSEKELLSNILRVPLGRNLSGSVVYMDINMMPHLLIAGATNSGKSSCINSIVISLLLKTRPSEVKFIMIDPKMVELSIYNGVPHLLAPVVINPKKASTALSWAVDEMENRLKILSDYNCKNLEQFNLEVQKNKSKDPDLTKLPYILIFIDELADLMIVAASEVEESINRIAQMGRAVGIHLIIATQRPSVNVITGVIKANIPSRVAFNVASNTDSRVILDMAGAEKLIGRGDMLYSPVFYSRPERLQGAFVTTNEIEIITDYIKDQKKSSYLKDIFQSEAKSEKKDMEDDPLIYEALEVFLEFGHASASLLQRRLRIGYSRAARIVDQLENRDFISGYDGAKPREVLISRESYLKLKEDMGYE